MESHGDADSVSATSGITSSRVLRKIRMAQRISRVDISRALNLNKSTVTKVVADFMDVGIVKVAAEGHAGPQGGRKPKYLTLDPAFGCVIGVEIRTDSWISVAVDLNGRIIDTLSEALAPGDLAPGGSRVVDLFLEIASTMREQLRRQGQRVLGAGLGIAGIIDHTNGIILQSNPLTIHEPVRVYEEASSRLGLPVLVDNDANCGCWAQLAYPETERHENSVFVLGEFRRPDTSDSDYRSISVGLGFVLGGKVHHGRDYSAGEFRSILWRPGNTTQFSVSDTESSRVREDPRLHERMYRELCDHIAFLVNTLNLDHVVFSDTFGFSSEYVIKVCREAIEENWSYSNQARCDIGISPLGERAVACGSAGMFLEHLFSVPDVSDPRTRMRTGVHLLADILKDCNPAYTATHQL